MRDSVPFRRGPWRGWTQAGKRLSAVSDPCGSHSELFSMQTARNEFVLFQNLLPAPMAQQGEWALWPKLVLQVLADPFVLSDDTWSEINLVLF